MQLLAGAGCSLLYVGILHGNIPITIHSNLPAMFAFAIALLIFLSFAVPLYFKYHFKRQLAYILLFLFAAYAVLLFCTGFGILVLV